MVGKGSLIAGLLIALLAPGIGWGQKFAWQDSPEYADHFFLGKVRDLPGYASHHERLRKLLRRDPRGNKLREGLRLINGKEDGISARIFASWFAQVDAPDVKVAEFRAITHIPSTVPSSKPNFRKREFTVLAISYFVNVIVRRTYHVSKLALTYDLSPSSRKKHEAIVKMALKLKENNGTFEMFGPPGSVSNNKLVDWAAYFGHNHDPDAARWALERGNRLQNFQFLCFDGLNDYVVSYHGPDRSPYRSLGTQGSIRFVPLWAKNKNNIGVALHVVRLGDTHPEIAWEAAKVLSKVDISSLQFVSQFLAAYHDSLSALMKRGYRGSQSLYDLLKERKYKIIGGAPKHAT